MEDTTRTDNKLRDAGDDAKRAAERAGDKMEDAGERAKDDASRVGHKVSDTIEDMIPGDSDRDGH